MFVNGQQTTDNRQRTTDNGLQTTDNSYRYRFRFRYRFRYRFRLRYRFRYRFVKSCSKQYRMLRDNTSQTYPTMPSWQYRKRGDAIVPPT